MTAALVLAALTALGAGAPTSSEPLKRFALIAGANDGGGDRVKLRYATSDAKTVARVLESLGGVATEHREILLEPSASEFRAGLHRVARRIAAATRDKPARTELLLYYSGHSDELGLLLGGERIPYAELRAWLSSAGADVRIAILDSCSSGAITRTKGGAHLPPFLSDASSELKGHAFLTSSSADEASQESDRIQASFFTHYLVSGLRGAADVTRDGRVTLNEAYHFAYQETLAQTERTRAGPQHPSYDIQLVGTGDLVMTELSKVSATLVLPERAKGRFFVRDANGRLVAELRKFGGGSVDLGLEPGTYVVMRENDGRMFEASVALAHGKRTPLVNDAFNQVALEATASRGGGVLGGPTDPATAMTLGLVPSIATSERPTYFSFGVLGARNARLSGFGLATGLHWTTGDMRGLQIASVNVAEGAMTGVQLGAIANVAGAQSKGFQLSAVNVGHSYTGGQVGFVNVGRELTGVQFGGVNVGTGAAGAQVGGVNIATRLSGYQFGAINIADELDGEAIGLVNVIGNGRRHIELMGGESAPVQALLRMGSRHLQTLYTAGFVPGNLLVLGGGFAFHFRGDEKIFFDVDVLVQSMLNLSTGSGLNVWAMLRPTIGYQLFPRVALIAGPTLNGYLPLAEGEPELGFGPTAAFTAFRRPGIIWVGFTGGIRF